MTVPTADKAKLYYQKMPATWWLSNRRYFLFILRELSSVFIAVFLVVFLIEIYQLTRSPAAYTAFIDRLGSAGWIIFHVVALLFALYHSLTWFSLTARVQVVRLGEHPVPTRLVYAGIIGGWLVISLLILLLFLYL